MQTLLDSSEAVSQCGAHYAIKHFHIREFNSNSTLKNVLTTHSNDWKMLSMLEDAI